MMMIQCFTEHVLNWRQSLEVPTVATVFKSTGPMAVNNSLFYFILLKNFFL